MTEKETTPGAFKALITGYGFFGGWDYACISSSTGHCPVMKSTARLPMKKHCSKKASSGSISANTKKSLSKKQLTGFFVLLI